MESKRRAFPRFYFVSMADLLDILSNGNNPVKVLIQCGCTGGSSCMKTCRLKWYSAALEDLKHMMCMLMLVVAAPACVMPEGDAAHVQVLPSYRQAQAGQ
jgi:hypothetical protein